MPQDSTSSASLSFQFLPRFASEPIPEVNTLHVPTSVLSRREARVVEAMSAAWQKGQSKCVVAELFSPPRFTLEAECQGLTGLSFDFKKWV